MREIVLDTETTGLEPSQGHRIIEIGCIELNNGTPTGGRYHTYLNPERDVPEESTRITNITTEMLVGKPLFADAVEGFLAFIADSPLVIHNAEFDLKFLNAELTRANKPKLDPARAVDTMLIARRRFPGSPASLDALCKRFNIGLEERREKGHGALLDVELLAQVYLELLGGRQRGLELTASDAGNGGRRTVKHQPLPARPQPLPARLSDEELARHEAAVQGLGAAAIWRN